MYHLWVLLLASLVSNVQVAYAADVGITSILPAASTAPPDPSVTAPPDARGTSAPDASFSSISGPFIDGPSYKWTKDLEANVIGTVIVTVDTSMRPIGSTTVFLTNTTVCVTSTETVARSIGTSTRCSILTLDVPESTNSAGTKVVNLANKTQLTYPTNYFGAKSEVTWVAVLPITTTGQYHGLALNGRPTSALVAYHINDLGNEGTCCFPSLVVQPMPTHLRIIPDTQPTDVNDPRGWLSDVNTFDRGAYYGGASYHRLPSDQVSSLYWPMSVTLPYTPCLHSWCKATATLLPSQGSLAAPVKSIANIYATSTTVLPVL